MIKHATKIILISIVLMMGAWGCSSVRMTTTDRSILEQQLMVQGIARALDGFDLTPFYGKRVSLEVTGLSEDEVAFTEDYLHVHLSKNGLQVVKDQNVYLDKNGIRVVTDPKDVELKFKVLAPVLAVDQSETLLGTPQFTFLGIPIPAIVLYRKVSNKSQAEIEMYVYDAKTDNMTTALPPGIGTATFDSYTILFVISWTYTDIKEREEDSGIRMIHTQG